MTGITYTLGRALYVALTNRSNACTLIASRGPGFIVPPASGFAPLQNDPGAPEVIEEVLKALDSASAPSELCFAGVGEPLLRLRTLQEVAAGIKAQKPDLRMRINTNGLMPSSEAAGVAAQLKKCGVSAACVALASSDAAQYETLMQPEKLRYSPVMELPLGLKEVTAFTKACVETGLEVECTAVEAPGVDIEAARLLAESLGASFRARTWHPAKG